MPGLVIKPRSRIYHGHDWIYSSEVQKIFGDPKPGDVITLKDFRDRPLGSAIYNPASQIVARRISRRKQDLDADFFDRRIRRALGVREAMGFAEPIYRLVWSEADGLPGVVVDRYGDCFTLQTLTLAMDQRKEMIVSALCGIFGDITIIERNDSSIRKAEELEPVVGVLAGTWNGPIAITVNGLHQEVDLLEGQKTGIYLDQLDNYAAVASYAEGKSVLDCFCNQGGFALHAAKAGAASVLAIDISEGAVAATLENAARNELTVDAQVANVFDFLKEAETAERKFDLIILDPPSFTKSRKAVSGAMRGYKEIHLRALKLLNFDGILSTYCCSHHVSEQEFFDVIVDASVDARRNLRLLATHSQRRDHPVLLTLPETKYLKGFTVQSVAGF
ncbi:MAG: class I SAM-dependent rRNA methyltransferase [Verrucomicrobiales bacterium]|jgi:23S rRNA (cytosine1962-C5)-methyltransferase|nr:class I SAM-dependent rRNA methyltransferase [Verrucomicrobiales bacterium]MBP9225492.1 class I SAM-dependent rRNA methyltransferase [Verrucomicrobiales bacterium]HQZ26631.1 class I SAM-dependent rRNA methyltransferase [Verrucomicrobiales bacterium]